MTIGEAAKASGVSAKMIRYYEQIGLIAPAARTASGYRLYSDADVHTLRFIRRARDLGFMVEGIAELLALWQDRSRHSKDVKRVAMEHVAALEQKIRELEGMAGTLRTLASCCAGDDRPDCPILEDMEEGEGSGSASGPHRSALRTKAEPRDSAAARTLGLTGQGFRLIVI